MTEKEEEVCPFLKHNPDASCPFLDRILDLEVDLKGVKVDVQWLKALVIPIFVGVLCLVLRMVVEVIILG